MSTFEAINVDGFDLEEFVSLNSLLRDPVRRGAPPREHQDTRKFLLSGLNRYTNQETVRDVFKAYGRVSHVELLVNDDGYLNGMAEVEFSEQPKKLDINKPVMIDGTNVAVKPVVMTENDQKYQSRVRCFSLTFGMFLEPKTYVNDFTVNRDVLLRVSFEEHRILIFFRHLDSYHNLEFKFQDLQAEITVEEDTDRLFLTFPLKYPPRFFWHNDDVNNGSVATARSVRSSKERINYLYMTADHERQAFSDPISLSQPAGLVQLSRWNVLRLTINTKSQDAWILPILLKNFAEFNLVPRQRHKGRVYTVKDASDLPPYKTHAERTEMLRYNVLYLLEALISSNLLMERNLDDDFYELMKQVSEDIVCGALEMMYNAKQRIWNPHRVFYDIWTRHRLKLTNPRKVPHHCALLRKVIVTPTTMYVHPPTLETTNRIVRHFREYADRFIRVTFLDDPNGRIAASRLNTTNNCVYNNVFKTLSAGIKIGNVHYDYLGFSSSQLREHGCWYFAPHPGTVDEDGNVILKPMDANKIRAWMGSFQDIKVVAKHAARIGQCFSSTRAIIELESDQVQEIPDIERNGFTFTDGCGNISPELAAEVARRLNLRVGVVPSAFQFRLGGAKGMLMQKESLKGYKVELRPSQIKFQSAYRMLEIVRTSSYIGAYLNRQAITLLSTLGVPDEVFLKMMQKVKEELDTMLSSSDDAIKMITAHFDEFGIAQSMVNIIGAGFLDQRDPYIMNLTHMFRVKMLKDLKEKAKIRVPDGAFLHGVADERGLLKEGEVFLQIAGAQGTYSVIQDDCVVWRNPCFHPGDIRVVKAVDCPQLHHLKDVLVFSTRGFRDIPSMCSGGDLDGDDFTILWDKAFMPKIVNHEAMNYTPDKPLIKEVVTTDDIQKFFVNYINNDNLGVIANAHLATADRSRTGAMDGACKHLAQLHSAAVDFPKTGRPAEMDRSLRVQQFPDFMNKTDKPTYKSEKVLGTMYRLIDSKAFDHYEESLEATTRYDPRLRVRGIEKFIARAREELREYNRDLLAVMNQYGIKTESEVVSNFVMEWSASRAKKNTYELHRELSETVHSLKSQWRQRFDADLQERFPASSRRAEDQSVPPPPAPSIGGHQHQQQHPRESHPEQEAKAAAWYYVTYHPTERERVLSAAPNGDDDDVSGSTMRAFLSFPWVLEDILVDMAKRRQYVAFTAADSAPIDASLIDQYDNMNSDVLFVDDDDSDSEASDADADADAHDDWAKGKSDAQLVSSLLDASAGAHAPVPMAASTATSPVKRNMVIGDIIDLDVMDNENDDTTFCMQQLAAELGKPFPNITKDVVTVDADMDDDEFAALLNG